MIWLPGVNIWPQPWTSERERLRLSASDDKRSHLKYFSKGEMFPRPGLSLFLSRGNSRAGMKTSLVSKTTQNARFFGIHSPRRLQRNLRWILFSEELLRKTVKPRSDGLRSIEDVDTIRDNTIVPFLHGSLVFYCVGPLLPSE